MMLISSWVGLMPRMFIALGRN